MTLPAMNRATNSTTASTTRQPQPLEPNSTPMTYHPWAAIDWRAASPPTGGGTYRRTWERPVKAGPDHAAALGSGDSDPPALPAAQQRRMDTPSYRPAVR